MSLSMGSGVSAGGSGSIDFDAIVAGGQAFADRLKKFTEAAKAAADTKAAATAMLKDAMATKAAAEQQLAENQAAAERLRAAQENLDHERAKLDRVLAAARA
jgi:hypothetical protein